MQKKTMILSIVCITGVLVLSGCGFGFGKATNFCEQVAEFSTCIGIATVTSQGQKVDNSAIGTIKSSVLTGCEQNKGIVANCTAKDRAIYAEIYQCYARKGVLDQCTFATLGEHAQCALIDQLSEACRSTIASIK